MTMDYDFGELAAVDLSTALEHLREHWQSNGSREPQPLTMSSSVNEDDDDDHKRQDIPIFCLKRSSFRSESTSSSLSSDRHHDPFLPLMFDHSYQTSSLSFTFAIVRECLSRDQFESNLCKMDFFDDEFTVNLNNQLEGYRRYVWGKEMLELYPCECFRLTHSSTIALESWEDAMLFQIKPISAASWTISRAFENRSQCQKTK